MGKSWTTEEDAIVRKNYPEGGSVQCEPFLERTKVSIKQRARKLGLNYDLRAIQQYSPEEEAIVREYYPKWGADKCAELLPKRSRHSVHKKAESMGISCDLIVQRQNLGLRTHDMPKGFYKMNNGYWTYSPDGKAENRKLYHRYVMEQHLGRELLESEIVHHIDHNKENNDISNLELTTRSEHIEMHRAELFKAQMEQLKNRG